MGSSVKTGGADGRIGCRSRGSTAAGRIFIAAVVSAAVVSAAPPEKGCRKNQEGSRGSCNQRFGAHCPGAGWRGIAVSD